MKKDFLFLAQGKRKLKGASFQSKQTGYREKEEVTFSSRYKLNLQKQDRALLLRAQPLRVKAWDPYLLDSKPGWREVMGDSWLWFCGKDVVVV